MKPGLQVELRNRTTSNAAIVVQNTLLDPAGKEVSRNGNDVDIPAAGTQIMSTKMTVNHPQRWDIDHPSLYLLVTEVIDANKKVVDRYETPFGIR